MVKITKSREETIKFAEEYGKTLRGGDVLLLDGEMGAGKTIFTKGIALALGVEADDVSSCLCEAFSVSERVGYHKMYVEGHISDPAYLLEYRQTVCDVIHENAVHDIEMEHIHSVILEFFYLVSHIEQVSAEH